MKKFTSLSAILLCTVWIAYGQWKYTNLSQPKEWMGSASIGNKIYFAGGYNGSEFLDEVQVYDVSTDTWDVAGGLFNAREFPGGSVACGSKIFFGGGFDWVTSFNTVDIYDTQSGEWSVEFLSDDRFSFAAVSWGTKVMFAGGVDYPALVYKTIVDIYDIQTGEWTTTNLSIAREGIAAAVVGDLALFAGGLTDNGVTNRVDIYNFSTGTWSIATLSQARGMASATTVGNKVIIAGGATNGLISTDRVDIYDASDGTWTTASLSVPRAAHHNAVTVGGKAYFAGGGKFGGSGYNNPSNVIDVYDPASDTWSVMNLQTARVQHSVIAVGDYLVVAGGKNNTGQLASVEIYRHPTLIHVPGDFATIQEAINEASHFDTVLVAEDTYYENINFIGKPILVASEFIINGDTNHINNTIIDGSQPVNPDIGSVVTFESGEDTTSVLCGFTITGGTGTVESSVNMRMGGGMQIKFSGGKFLNNHIHGNSVSYNEGVFGGGMQLGGPISEIPWIVLRGNRIYNNEAKSNANYATGGGFICFYNLIMENNEISHNEANGYLGGDGGGMECMGAFGPIELKINQNLIMHNEANASVGSSDYAGLGAGMCFAFNCWGTIKNNDISYNSIDAPNTFISWGPGAFVQDITANNFIFENNIIEGNIANTTNCRGGGLSLLRAGGIYQNNVLRNNTASLGGGISIGYNNEVSDTAILINNTITENEATTGGGIHVQSSKSVIVNSIVWGNEAANAPSIYQTGSTIEVRYSDVEGDVLWPGLGNVNCTPTFLADGYHLDPACQLVDAGITSVQINGIWYACPPYDIDGDARPYVGTQPEMGADEIDLSTWVHPVKTDLQGVEIYPNPADKLVNIMMKGDAVIGKVILYNTAGQKVYNGLPDEQVLDVSALRPGIYLLEVHYDRHIARQKLIID